MVSIDLNLSLKAGWKSLSLAIIWKSIPLSFSADFEALNSLASLQSFPFMCRHQISEPIHKVSGFACASKISAAVRVIDCSVCLAIFRHHRGLREPQKVSLNLSLKLCHPPPPPPYPLSHRTNPLLAVFLL